MNPEIVVAMVLIGLAGLYWVLRMAMRRDERDQARRVGPPSSVSLTRDRVAGGSVAAKSLEERIVSEVRDATGPKTEWAKRFAVAMKTLSDLKETVSASFGRDVSLEEARKIIYAFANFMGNRAPNSLLDDSGSLPFPKELIYAAFFIRIRDLEFAKAIGLLQNDQEQELDQTQALMLRISDYQEIDEEDLLFVREETRESVKRWLKIADDPECGQHEKTKAMSICRKSLELQLKYMRRGEAEQDRMCKKYGF